MKLLIVGIDGGTAGIFDAFDMPFWQSLRRNDVTFDVTEDLNQRGWARMLSGKGAEETGGLYMRPFNDQSFKFDFSYNYKMLSQTPGFVPIWQLAQRTGARVGMMNVPTTAPAQSVNGFYVSGGGGGLNQGGLPQDAVFPMEDREVLETAGYIFDTRIGAEGFTDADVLCGHIIDMMTRRTDVFIKLAKRHEIDFGFLAYRATTVLLFLAMSEIAHILRQAEGKGARQSWSSPWLERVNTHMRTLDGVLSRLFDELQPENYILTSDHSMVPWTHNIDFNGFLVEAGLAQRNGSFGNTLRNIARAARRPKFRKQLAQVPAARLPSALQLAGAPLGRQPRAFSGGYVYGIYVNDADRFGGPVREADVRAETASIVDAFNWAALQQGVDMRAAPYRETFEGAAQQSVLPDVTILQSGHAFPASTVGHWYVQNPNFGPVLSVKGVGGMHSGQKGRHPILMANKALAARHDADAPADLRLVHALTAAVFEGTS